jgi:hypothetical protein
MVQSLSRDAKRAVGKLAHCFKALLVTRDHVAHFRFGSDGI